MTTKHFCDRCGKELRTYDAETMLDIRVKVDLLALQPYERIDWTLDLCRSCQRLLVDVLEDWREEKEKS